MIDCRFNFKDGSCELNIIRDAYENGVDAVAITFACKYGGQRVLMPKVFLEQLIKVQIGEYLEANILKLGQAK